MLQLRNAIKKIQIPDSRIVAEFSHVTIPKPDLPYPSQTRARPPATRPLHSKFSVLSREIIPDSHFFLRFSSLNHTPWPKRIWRAPRCPPPPQSIAPRHAGIWEWSDRKGHIAVAELLDIASEVDPRKRGAGCFSLKMFRSACPCAAATAREAAHARQPPRCFQLQHLCGSCGIRCRRVRCQAEHALLCSRRLCGDEVPLKEASASHK